MDTYKIQIYQLTKKYWLPLIFLSVVALFSATFSYFFVQDDFFHLKMSRAENLGEFLSFFSLKNKYGYQFYRPLTTQVFLFFGRKIFGLNPLGFHLISFLFFCANVFLVFKLAATITKKVEVGFLAAFFYAFSSAHFATLAYLSTFEEIGVAFFYFLTILLYLKKVKIAPLFFVLALMCRETAITLPLMILVLEFYQEGKWGRLFPYFLILGIYLVLRWQFNFVSQSPYSLKISPKIFLNNLFWYINWSAGVPESLLDFLGPGLKLNPRFLQIFGWQGKIIIFGSLTLVAILVANLLINLIKPKQRKTIFLFGFWFLASILPFLFLSQHKYVYYLEIPLLGFAGLMGLVVKSSSKLWQFLIIFFFLLTSVLTVRFYEQNYWVVGRAKLSEKLVSQLMRGYPKLPKGATLYFKNNPKAGFISQDWGGPSTQAYYALSGENGPQVIYNDDTLKVYYEDITGSPKTKDFFEVVTD